jgi:hypothetical protein
MYLPHVPKMVSLRSSRDKQISGPSCRKVLSVREKEAAAKKTDKTTQKEARRKFQVVKKAQAQLPAIELVNDNDDDDNDLVAVLVPSPAATIQG